jgi:arachidonate 15-lipoxygenase
MLGFVETPSLPADDPNPSARAEGLARCRTEYEFDYATLSGIPVAKHVPRRDNFSASYIVKTVEGSMQMLENEAAIDLVKWTAIVGLDLARLVIAQVRKPKKRGFSHLVQVVDGLLGEGVSGARPDSTHDYARMFSVIQEPAIAKVFREDRMFAWQRLAGANPMVIQQVKERLPDNFPVSEEHYRRAGLAGTLAQALAEGRLFVADYAIMDGLPTGTFKGIQKHLSAPLALFCSSVPTPENPGGFLPVAVQCTQTPGPASPIFTPADGSRWMMAKNTVKVADFQYHEMVFHLGRTHLIVERFLLSTRRQLAARHPLRVLLEPHFQFTLAINDHAFHSLAAPGGPIELLMAGTLASSLEITHRATREYVFHEAAMPRALELRGVADAEHLPLFPYRDDARLIWKAIDAFVRGYVRLYYATDADVVGDVELQAWARELVAEDGARLVGLLSIDSIANLAATLTQVIFTASAQHSAVNFAQFPFFGVVPNLPAAAYAPPPDATTPNEEASYLAMLPPLDAGLAQMNLSFQLSWMHYNRLGHYPSRHFADGRVAPLVTAFQDALATAESAITNRNAARLFPYPFLLPSMIPASINI